MSRSACICSALVRVPSGTHWFTDLCYNLEYIWKSQICQSIPPSDDGKGKSKEVELVVIVYLVIKWILSISTVKVKGQCYTMQY